MLHEREGSAPIARNQDIAITRHEELQMVGRIGTHLVDRAIIIEVVSRQLVPCETSIGGFHGITFVSIVEIAVGYQGIVCEFVGRGIECLESLKVNLVVVPAKVGGMEHLAHVASDVIFAGVGRVDGREEQGAATADAPGGKGERLGGCG
jgi:hypothetical protein